MWKTECQNMVPLIGSGKFIMTAIITDDGQPLQEGPDPILGEGWNVNSTITDKRVSQWMRSLHQIGKHLC